MCFFFVAGFILEEVSKTFNFSPTMQLSSTWPPKSMLSYILPVDSSKQSQNDTTHVSTDQQHQQRLQLSLLHGRFANGNATTTTITTPISKETSVSSFASDGTTATISHNTSSSMTNTSASDRHKTTKIIINGKHQPLKR